MRRNSINNNILILVGIFVIIIFIGFWSIASLLPLIFVFIFIFYKDLKNKYTFTLLDLSFVLIVFSEIITFFLTSVNNHWFATFNLYIILFFYFFYKRNFKFEQKKFFFVQIIFFLITFLVLLTIGIFFAHYSILLDVGFVKLNEFKNRYNPFGIWNNLWSSILILLLPFTLIFLLIQKINKFKFAILLVIQLLVFSIVISFSRGVYLSLIFFILSLNILTFRIFKLKKLLIYNIIVILMLFISTSVVKNSVFTTLSFNKTISQQRSTSGRIEKWKNILPLITEKPITGWGNNNYILAQDKSTLVSLEDTDFNSKTDNTYLQILIEKGFLGFFCYLSLFIICCYIIYKGINSKTTTKKQKLELAIIFSGLIAFSVRELTFSSVFSNNTVYFLFFHLVFFLIPYDIELKKISVSQRFKKGILFILLLVTSFIAYIYIKQNNTNMYNNCFIEAYNKNDKIKSFDFLNKAIELSPNNLILNKHETLLLSKYALQIDISNKHPNFIVFKNIKKDTLEISKKYFQKILTLNPYDDETYHNLGWTYFALNKKDSAKVYFKKTLTLRPYNSTYIISKILYDVKNGNYKNIITNLSKVLRYSPEILESIFYREFAIKYNAITVLAEKEAIFGLQNTLKKENNPILKARLARLLLNKNPTESLRLLKEVTASLPNLSRPWLYKAFLHEKLNDTIMAKKNYKKAIFLNRIDFLPKLYYANFLKSNGNKKSINFYKETLQSYNLIKSQNFIKNKTTSDLITIRNSYIPNDLLFYVNPIIPTEEIYDYFINYYKSTENVRLEEYYKQQSEKLTNQIYKGSGLIK